MAYGRRKKGGQRLMEMSRAGTKRRIAKNKAVKKAPAKKKAAPKSTVGGRNKTALRTPKSASRASGKLKPARIPIPELRKMKGGEDLLMRSGASKKSPYKTTPKQPRSVMRADNPTLTERARRFAEKLFPSHMGMEPYAPSMGDAALEVGKRYIGSRVAGGGLSAARNSKKALTAVSGAASKVGSAAKDVAKSAIAQTRRRPMPKVSASKAKEGVKRQQQRVGTGKEVTTPKPRSKKAADQKNLERQQRAGVKGARSKAAEKVLKDAEKKKPAKTVSKKVLSKASSKSSGPKYRSTARPSSKVGTKRTRKKK